MIYSVFRNELNIGENKNKFGIKVLTAIDLEKEKNNTS
jgi:hypothetical protein